MRPVGHRLDARPVSAVDELAEGRPVSEPPKNHGVEVPKTYAHRGLRLDASVFPNT